MGHVLYFYLVLDLLENTSCWKTDLRKKIAFIDHMYHWWLRNLNNLAKYALYITRKHE